ncbi:MAG: 50S ribosomal protein L22 [Deltaproteobacteria bacterium]|nr:50S ribosomal protein L22 [Deltaproteobacteria bacterium]
MIAKATLRKVRVSPRKARLVADLVRGMDVDQALEVLTFTRKKSAPLIKKLLESAIANAEQVGERGDEAVNIDKLYIQSVTVDGGPTQRRFRPRALGRATKVIKRTSHITLVLDEREER